MVKTSHSGIWTKSRFTQLSLVLMNKNRSAVYNLCQTSPFLSHRLQTETRSKCGFSRRDSFSQDYSDKEQGMPTHQWKLDFMEVKMTQWCMEQETSFHALPMEHSETSVFSTSFKAWTFQPRTWKREEWEMIRATRMLEKSDSLPSLNLENVTGRILWPVIKIRYSPSCGVQQITPFLKWLSIRHKMA